MKIGIRTLMIQTASKIARASGFDLVEKTYRNNPDLRLASLLRHHGINLILDVGANIGQYGSRLRDIGYNENIVSFEPLSSAFAILERETRKYKNWNAVNIGLGDSNGTARLNISGNSQSSSFLNALPRLISAAPKASIIGHEDVTVRTLDSIAPEFFTPETKPFLKIDAQGYEKKVCAGARNSICHLAGIQIETPLMELYGGEMLFRETLDFLISLGFTLCSVEYGFTDKSTGQLLEVDCIFFRENSHSGTGTLNH